MHVLHSGSIISIQLYLSYILFMYYVKLSFCPYEFLDGKPAHRLTHLHLHEIVILVHFAQRGTNTEVEQLYTKILTREVCRVGILKE